MHETHCLSLGLISFVLCVLVHKSDRSTMDSDSDGDGKFEWLVGFERWICYSWGRKGCTMGKHTLYWVIGGSHTLQQEIPIRRFRYVILKIGSHWVSWQTI